MKPSRWICRCLYLLVAGMLFACGGSGSASSSTGLDPINFDFSSVSGRYWCSAKPGGNSTATDQEMSLSFGQVGVSVVNGSGALSVPRISVMVSNFPTYLSSTQVGDNVNMLSFDAAGRLILSQGVLAAYAAAPWSLRITVSSAWECDKLLDSLSAIQDRFEAWIKAGVVTDFSWFLRLPSPDVVTDYLFASIDSVSTSLQTRPQAAIIQAENLADGLSIPDLARKSVLRGVVNGRIVSRNKTSKVVLALVGTGVEYRYFADDGVTLGYIEVVDGIGESTPLTGAVTNTEVFKKYYDFMSGGTSSSFDTALTWTQNSAYATVQSYYKDTLLMLLDWTGQTYDANVTPYSGTETTIEGFFGRYPSWTFAGSSYSANSGVISTVNGARIWRATTALPAISSPTTAYRALVELNGHLYVGQYYPAHSRRKYKNQLDSTLFLEERIVLNRPALTTLKRAVLF